MTATHTRSMTRTRTSASLAFAAALTGSALSWAVAMPVANADPLPNGYDVSCTPNGNGAVCHVSGCPRVHDDEAGDVVHVRFNAQPQNEIGKGCGDTIDVSTSLTQSTVNVASGFTFSIQGCRKHNISDDCGAWSDYKFTPPAPVAPPPAPVVPPPAAAPVVPPPAAPVQCPSGSTTPTVPAGQSCTAAVVTNAIALSFGPPSFGNITATVRNSSDLTGNCTYDATGLADTHRDFTVGAKGSTTLSFNGFNTGTTYHATVNCTDASGKQTQPIGSDSKDVRF